MGEKKQIFLSIIISQPKMEESVSSKTLLPRIFKILKVRKDEECKQGKENEVSETNEL